MQNSAFVFNFYKNQFAKHKAYLIIPIIFAVFMACYETASPYIIKLLIDKMVNFDRYYFSWGAVFGPAIAYIVLTEAANLMFRARDWFKLKILPEIKSSIFLSLYGHLLRHSYRFFQDNRVGSLSNRMNELIKGSEAIICFCTDVILWRTLSIFVAGGMITTVSLPLAGLIILWGIGFVSISLKLSKTAHINAVKFAKSRNLLFGLISDVFTNIVDVILFHSAEPELAQINEYLTLNKKKERAMLWSMFKISMLQGGAVTLFTTGLIFGLLNAFENNALSLGDFAFVIIVSGTIVRNVYSISTDLVQLSKDLGSCTEAIQILTQPIEITDLPNAEVITVSKGEIVLQRFSFGYDIERPILACKYLAIPAGQKVALVGLSGGGKTTLINLLARMFDLQSGDIFIDGQNIKHCTLASLRSNITMISQEPALFNRTIRENIGYASSNVSFEQIVAAAQQAHCHDFIKQLPNGYDTLVGERGVKLSGGQKQRIAIARAFLRNTKILILDEPTSALDLETESYVHESFTRLWQGKTVIVVAHRLSTLKRMDRILVIDTGNICQDGTHEQLIAQPGLYHDLCLKQDTDRVSSREMNIYGATVD